jgi:SAM-dependent methyltransferase
VDGSATTIDLYDALAPIYDGWQASAETTPFALVTEAKLSPQLERVARGDGFSFLDLGCGTGMLLAALRAAHPDWRLAGIDASPGMLAVASRRPGAGTIAWLRAALDRPLPLARRFDAAGAFYDTLNHLPDLRTLTDAFTGVARVLQPGGLFAFDVTNRLGFERWWHGTRRFTAAHWRITIDAAFIGEVGWAEVEIEREGRRPRHFQLREQLYDDDQILSALRAAGLTPEDRQLWSPFELDVPGKTWWVATAPKG